METPLKHKQAACPGTCRLLGWDMFAVLLDGADLLCQPGCPFLDASPLVAAMGKMGACGLSWRTLASNASRSKLNTGMVSTLFRMTTFAAWKTRGT